MWLINSSTSLWVQENNCEVNYKSGTSAYLTAARTVATTNYIMTPPLNLAKNLLNYEELKIIPLPGKVPEIQLDLIWHSRFENEPTHKWMREKLVALV